MNAKKFFVFVSVIALFALLLSACGPKTYTAEQFAATATIQAREAAIDRLIAATPLPAVVVPPAQAPVVATSAPILATAATQAPTANPSSNEHGNLPQPQIGHPNYYIESGVSGTEYTWILNVQEGEIGIVGGAVVNGQDGGVYRAYAQGNYTIKVINGFALTTKAEWSKTEFQFRLDQATKYGWAKNTVDWGPIK